MVAIKGVSGSGKTTLLNILGCIDRPDAGQVLIAGENVHEKRADELSNLRRRVIGVVFQRFNLLMGLTAIENVLVPPKLVGVSGREAIARAAQALETVGLASKASRRPAELSEGEKQRVAIARAVVNGPRLLLADEPTGSLDATNKEAVLSLLRMLVTDSGMAAVVVTHDQRVADACDTQYVLENGSLRLA